MVKLHNVLGFALLMYLRSPSENLETIANQIKHLKREVNNYNQYTTGLLYLGFAECVFYFPSETCTTWGIYNVFFLLFFVAFKQIQVIRIHSCIRHSSHPLHC